MTDRLYRSRSERVISGVAGGLAERLDVDPSIVRVVWVILAVLSGGLFALVYLVMMVVVPETPFDAPDRAGGPDPWSSPAATGIRPSPTAPPASTGPSEDVPGTATEETSTFATVGASTPASPETASRPGSWRTRPDRRRDSGGGLVLGLLLILVGAWFLIREYLPQVDLDATWPLLAVAAGVLLVVVALVPGRS